jgi:hypothetical protein
MHKRKIQAFPPHCYYHQREGIEIREYGLFEVVLFSGRQGLKYTVKLIQRRKLRDLNIFLYYNSPFLFRYRVCFSANFISRNMDFDKFGTGALHTKSCRVDLMLNNIIL